MIVQLYFSLQIQLHKKAQQYNSKQQRVDVVEGTACKRFNLPIARIDQK